MHFIGESRGGTNSPFGRKILPKQVIVFHLRTPFFPDGEKYNPDRMQSLLDLPMQFTHKLLQQKHITYIHNVVRIK